MKKLEISNIPDCAVVFIFSDEPNIIDQTLLFSGSSYKNKLTIMLDCPVIVRINDLNIRNLKFNLDMSSDTVLPIITIEDSIYSDNFSKANRQYIEEEFKIPRQVILESVRKTNPEYFV